MKVVREVKTITTEYIELNGIKFYKDGKGYWLGTVNKKPKRLHIYVWECVNGSVPKGYHIHHVDLDKDNNDIDNLVAMEKEEHLRLHALLNGQDEEYREKRRKVLYENRHLAAEWHGSEEGRETSRRNWYKSLGIYMEQMITLECDNCGKKYETSVISKKHSRFCGNKCKSAYRRKLRLDDVEKECFVCGKKFFSSKYDKVKTCSKECGTKLMLLNRNGIRRF